MAGTPSGLVVVLVMKRKRLGRGCLLGGRLGALAGGRRAHSCSNGRAIAVRGLRVRCTGYPLRKWQIARMIGSQLAASILNSAQRVDGEC